MRNPLPGTALLFTLALTSLSGGTSAIAQSEAESFEPLSAENDTLSQDEMIKSLRLMGVTRPSQMKVSTWSEAYAIRMEMAQRGKAIDCFIINDKQRRHYFLDIPEFGILNIPLEGLKLHQDYTRAVISLPNRTTPIRLEGYYSDDLAFHLRFCD